MVALSMRSVQVDSKHVKEYFRCRGVVFTPANALSAKFMTAIRLGLHLHPPLRQSLAAFGATASGRL